MNPLDMLTAADPARDRVPNPTEAERMDGALRHLLAAVAEEEAAPRAAAPHTGAAAPSRSAAPHTGAAAPSRSAAPHAGTATPRRARPVRRPARRWALVPVAAGALYAAFALGAPDDGPRQFTPAPASAATVLADLSRKVAAAPAPTGKYAYEKRLSYVSHMRPKPGGKGTFVVVLPHEDEQWIADDGTGVVHNVVHFGRPTFPTPEDKADYETADRPPPMDWKPYSVEDMTVAGLSAAEVRALPTDPAKLRARIEGGDITLTAMVGQLLATALTPPEVKVALFEVLKSLPGATLLPDVKDPQGRTGVGVEFDTPAWKTLFLFDPQTGALLATRSIGRKEVPGRNIDDWSLVIASGRRDEAPTVVTDRTLTRKVA